MGPESISESHLTGFATVGMRVVLRVRLPDHQAAEGGPSLTDVVGEVTALDDDQLTVQTRHGMTRVPRADVLAAKQIPPRAARRGRTRPAIGINHLERLMVAGMPPLHQAWLGDWLLRASNRYTGRANSCLVTGSPGVEAAAALEEISRWYDERDLPPMLQVPGPTGADPAATELGRVLTEHGWHFHQRTAVMVRRVPPTRTAIPTGTGGPPPDVEIAARASEAWWSASGTRTGRHRSTAEQILARVADPAYLTARVAGHVAGHLRLACHDGWAGLYDLHTADAQRRRGVGSALLTAADEETARRGIATQYLQVSADNDAALRLYDAHGWAVHHEYHYARRPG